MANGRGGGGIYNKNNFTTLLALQGLACDSNVFFLNCLSYFAKFLELNVPFMDMGKRMSCLFRVGFALGSGSKKLGALNLH
jgi:hypothetical protein